MARRGQQLNTGSWTLHEALGRGGNGVVYRATRVAGESTAALKILNARCSPKAIVRFQSEAEAYRRCRDIPGVLPLLDQHFPERPTAEDRPWIVLGLAEGFERALGKNPSLEKVVEACAQIATTLAKMHERGISHRDIKPENLFRYQQLWAVGDLGLVDFDDKSAVTEEGEKLGPRNYIAPEMLNSAVNADGRAADVHSLAKTLWKVATGQNFPPPGDMRRTVPALTLSAYLLHGRAIMLDPILELATMIEPDKRLSMVELANELNAWLAPPRANATSEVDLSDLVEKVKVLHQPFVVWQQQDKERADFIDAQSKRIREVWRPLATELEAEIKKIGFRTSLSIDNVRWGFEVCAAIEPLEFAMRTTIRVTERGRATVTASYVLNPEGSAVVLWRATRDFIVQTSGETIALDTLVHEMRMQFRPSVERLLSAPSHAGDANT